MRRAALLALALAPALAGCETTAEKSAGLEKQALREAAIQARLHPLSRGLRIARASTHVRAVEVALVHGSEAVAAVVTVQNTSGRALDAIPVAIEARDAHGRSVYSNTAAGIALSLTRIPYLPAHGRLTWIDDQVQSTAAVSLSARVGEGSPAPAKAPAIVLGGVSAFQDPSNGAGAEGTVSNRSTVAQGELSVYALARRGGRVIAAGRAVLPSLAPGQSARFQAFLVGDPAGAAIQADAPPTTLR